MTSLALLLTITALNTNCDWRKCIMINYNSNSSFLSRTNPKPCSPPYSSHKEPHL